MDLPLPQFANDMAPQPNGIADTAAANNRLDGDGQDQDDGQGTKALTSRYRGVCWNKKNRRWQAAINSGGKYLYLGSFLSEEDAARAFDRAAIRLRGKRSKLNFTFSDYTDDAGNLKEDARLTQVLSKVDQKHVPKDSLTDGPFASMMYGARAHRPSQSLFSGGGGDWQRGKAMESALELFQQHHLASLPHLQQQGGRGNSSGGAINFGAGGGNLLAAQLAAGGQHGDALRALLASGFMQGAGGGGGGGNGGVTPAPPPRPAGNNGGNAGGGGLPDMRLPPNCAVSSVIQGEDDTLGVIYLNSLTHQFGSAVWDGLDLHDLGFYDSEKDARQSCLCTMRIVLSHKKSADTPADMPPSLAHHFGSGGGGNNSGGGGAGSGGVASGLDALALLQGDNKAMLMSMAAGAGGMDGHLGGGFLGGGGGSHGTSGGGGSGGGGAIKGLSMEHDNSLSALHGGGNMAGGGGNGEKASYNELFQWLSAFNKDKAAAASQQQQQQQQQVNLEAAAMLANLAAVRSFGMNGGGGGGEDGGGGNKRGSGMSMGDGGEADGSAKKMRSGSGGAGVSAEFAAMSKLGGVSLTDALKTLFPDQQRGGGVDA